VEVLDSGPPLLSEVCLEELLQDEVSFLRDLDCYLQFHAEH
jgi:hypothetical protein